MRHVKERRPSGGTCVDDLEDCLEIPIQVHGRSHDTVELEDLVTFVPPPVRNPSRQFGSLTGGDIQAAAADQSGQYAPADSSLLILHEMHVERRAFSLRRKRAPEMETLLTAVEKARNLEALARVPVLQDQSRGHGFTRYEWDSVWAPDRKSGRPERYSPSLF
jgi:hypothetical protein